MSPDLCWHCGKRLTNVKVVQIIDGEIRRLHKSCFETLKKEGRIGLAPGTQFCQPKRRPVQEDS